MKNLEFKLTAIDEASGVVAAASKRISDSLNEVSQSQTGVAQSTEETISPLSMSERAQLENAGASLQLKTAELDLKDAQENLNGAIRGYGTNSKEAAAALRDFNSAQANVSTLQAQVGATTEQNTASMRSFATGLSGAATASFSLYSAIDRIEQTQIRADRANLMVHSSTKAVDDAQRALTAATSKYGPQVMRLKRQANDTASLKSVLLFLMTKLTRRNRMLAKQSCLVLSRLSRRQ